jgi:hypothetical protein
MDDHKTNREGGEVTKRLLQFALGRLFGAMFWGCIFLGAFWTIQHELANGSHHWLEGGGRTAVTFALFAASPFIAIATLLNRPIWRAAVG